MLETTVVLLTLSALVGVVGGTLLGLVGVGTTLLAVPYLTIALPLLGLPEAVSPLVAVATSISVVAVAAASSVRAHLKRGNILRNIVKLALPGSILGVIAGTFLARHLPAEALRLLFGGFLIFVAGRMLLKRLRPPLQTTGAGTDAIVPWAYRTASALFGMTGALVGGGGNVFMVPFLRHHALSMPQAVGTATAIALPVTVVGGVFYAFAAPPLSDPHLLGLIHLPAFAGLAIGNAIGAPIGARLGGRFASGQLEIGFAVVLLILATRMLFV